MNGVIVVDKPAGFTSFDVVAVARGLTREKKIGHTGTLDPMATGVLPLLLGRGAKAADLLPDTDKEYRAAFRLGEQRDTGDSTGEIIRTDSVPVSRERLEAALDGFRGEIRQVPPMYSAVSVGGKRLYQLARQGKEAERPARQVVIFRLDLEEYREESREGTLLVSCSKGTYIRTLIEDLAQAAGTCGTMTALRRTRACGFAEDRAVSLETLRSKAAEGTLYTLLQPVDTLFEKMPAVEVSHAQAIRFQNGGTLAMERLRMPRIALVPGDKIRIYRQQQFLGLAQADPAESQLKFLKYFGESL